ncbi:MAG TPA: cobalt transporter CbiM [Anaerolineae bacterium]
MLYSPAYMHIPDGYLSPATCMIFFGLVLPFWYLGVRKLRERMNSRYVPVIALMAAFSFIIMMFNVPLPGGTTGHAVAGALVAIVLGPEVATIAISIALVIQAFFFGDGGILAIGANCFNMAVLLPYVSYATYHAISRNTSLTSRWRIAGAAIGGYVGLTVSAFFTAVEFGIQPIFWHAADGTPLYAPYPLSVSIPAMVIPHMLIASIVEGAVAALAVIYLQRANSTMLGWADQAALGTQVVNGGRLRWLWVGLTIMIVATPLGLLAPGTAWGEWGADQLGRMGLKFIPQGLKALEGLWGAPMARYDLPALGNPSLGYILSAVVGIILIGIVTWLFTRLFASARSAQPAERK